MKKIIKKIKGAKKIAIFTHTKPDPDALGSLSSLCEFLNNSGKETVAFVEEKIKHNFEFLNLNYVKTECNFDEFDLVISVDVASEKMLGKFEDGFVNHYNSIAIDHHSTRNTYSKFEYVEDNASSCAEIVYKLIKNMKGKINPRLATLIYLGLAGDTGCFVHDNTTANGHILASELLKRGADFKTVNRKLFKSKSKARLKLVKLALENFDFYKNTLIVTVSYDEFKSINYNPDDGVELIDFVAGIENVDISVLITERKKGNVSVSFRSTENYDVSAIAKKFGGGGHKAAAGCKDLIGSVEDIKTLIFKELKKII